MISYVYERRSVFENNNIFNVEICGSFLLFLDQFLDEKIFRQIVF
jgi:hypothetical protein